MVKLAVIQAAAAFAGITSVALSSPTVTIDSGVLVGVQTSVANSPNIVNAYLGVPFAASPTRFSPPQTPSPFTQPYQANQRGPACIQQFSYPLASAEFSIAAFNTPAPAESEDCLLLQIYAPANATHGSLPVLHWIYGGSLAFGWSGAAAYDGTSFAANQNVVLVASNYRTNVFGFPGPVANLTQPNLGFLDQHFALQWVQRNIAAFGGDPNKVTIFGESAGAFSVDALVTSFNSTTPPPFRGAITESGEISVTPQPPNTGSSWATLISQLNCTQRGFGSDELACARATNASVLKNIEEILALSFNEAVDNNTYIADANRARAEGKIWPTPILTGTNAQEGSIFTSAYNDTTAYLNTTIPGLTAGQIAAIKSFYPIGSYGVNGRLIANQMQQISAIFTDLVFQCPCAIVSNTSVSANIPAWRYFYNSTFANIVLIPGVTLPFKPGVYHSSEIALVFGTYPIYTTNGGPTAQQMRVSEYMQDAWATFARNPQGGPGWPSSAQGGYVHSIGGDGGFPERGYGLTTSSSASALDDGRCALYEPVYQIVSGG